MNPKSHKHCLWVPPDSGNTDSITLITGMKVLLNEETKKAHFSPVCLSLMRSLVRSQGHVLLRCLFMGQVEEEDAGESADQEDHVKPAVVEVKL